MSQSNLDSVIGDIAIAACKRIYAAMGMLLKGHIGDEELRQAMISSVFIAMGDAVDLAGKYKDDDWHATGIGSADAAAKAER